MNGDRFTYPCGCVNEVHVPGLLRSVSKCDGHLAERRDPATLGEDYYRSLGALDADAPARYVGELVETLGEFPSPWCPYALEIGGGVSPYYAAIRGAGYYYAGVDVSDWASRCMLREHGDGLIVGDFAAVPINSKFGFILALHCLEHMADAPAAIAKAARLLAPGGELWIIVPDDTDPVNPEHEWFFSPRSLRDCVKAAGLEVWRVDVRKRIERENFIYLRARKP